MPGSRLAWQDIALVAGLLAAIWVLVKLWPVFLLILISVLLAMALLPVVEALAKKRVPRWLAVLGLMLLLLAVVAALTAFLVPSLISEFKEINKNLPDYTVKVEDLLGGIGIDVQLSGKVQNIDWGRYVSGQVGLVAGQKVLTIGLAVISTVVMTAYILVEAPSIGRFFCRFLDADKQSQGRELFWKSCKAVGGYFRGQLITSTAIGIFTFALLQILGVRNALAFAVIAAIADVVPLVGVFAAILPPVAAALQESSTTALIVFVALLAYQQFEDRLLVPYVYGRALRVSPLVVLISVLIGAQLLGIIGVLLALPLAAIGRVLMDHWLDRRSGPMPTESEPDQGSDAGQSLPDSEGSLVFRLKGMRFRIDRP